VLGADIFKFAQDGGKIMIKNGWMEEPPQIEDRNQLTK
jgi:nitrogen fixation protein